MLRENSFVLNISDDLSRVSGRLSRIPLGESRHTILPYILFSALAVVIVEISTKRKNWKLFARI